MNTSFPTTCLHVCVQCVVWLWLSRFSTSQPIRQVCHWMLASTHTHTLDSVVGLSYPTHPSHVHLFGLTEKEGQAMGWEEGEQGEAATTNTSGAARGMAVEGYFLLLCSTAFLITAIPPSQSVNLAHLLKHVIFSSSSVPSLQTHTVLNSTSTRPWRFF